VTSPRNGARIRGTVWLRASATAGFGRSVTKVEFEITDGTGHTVTEVPTSTRQGWFDLWNTTSQPDGRYSIRSVIFDSQRRSVVSSSHDVMVDNG
jgi:hypothetical protein